MISRALSALVILGSVGLLSAQTPTYQRAENFGTIPSNWRATSTAQFFGYAATRITGGPGAAGGFFVPTRRFGYYSDRFLGGALRRGQVISARGRLVLVRTSGNPAYTGTAYIGHFGRPVEGYVIETLGIALIGQGNETIRAAAILQFNDGRAYLGREIAIPTNARAVLDWTYDWNPTAGTRGGGQLEVTINGSRSVIELGTAAADGDFGLNTFGIYQPPFYDGVDSNSFFELYVGSLRYTAGRGRDPIVNIRANGRIDTTVQTVAVRGTARVSRGNRVRSVQVRVVQGNRVVASRQARGTTDWNVNVSVPRGRSVIEVIARSDSGRQGTDRVLVQRP